VPELHFPWIETAILLPTIIAIFVARMVDRERARQVAAATAAAVLVLCLGEWIDFTRMGTFEAHDHWDFVQWVFHREIFIVDALSAPLLPLGALLYTTMIATTLRTKINRFSFHWTLVSLSILLATLACRDAWGVIGLLTASCLPVGLELANRGKSVRVFGLHMGISLACLAVGQTFVILFGGNSTGMVVGGSLLTAGCLIRAGIFPLHCWMTDLFEKATFGTAILFVTPMIGAYAVMRLVFPIAPEYALQTIAVLSLTTSVYAAAMSLVQTEMRRMFAFIFLSHSSLVLVGLELATPIGLAGGLLVWLSVGIALLGFALALRSVEARTGRLSLVGFHGLYDQTPFLAGMFLITGLASIGFPGTIGFLGMEMLLEGVVNVYPTIGVMVAITAAINGISVVRAYFHIFTGKRHPSSSSLGCRPVERTVIVLMLALIVGGGLWPQPGVTSRYKAAKEVLDHRSPELSASSYITDSEESSGSLLNRSLLNRSLLNH
jgi:NADH-quinone oxidoreductase subunit M